ncbi:diacylglycerol/lipid kinase family protein [Amorphus orientalis]|uniref:YegS/Rv2252/BmrU family lipid kinase n=1 Tax=Amorphus orientalis TaxID=649198 RepID=A0AAE3VQ88_9HYPH|nr:diacylglycerol kinase family protein [Amorphus orientalis]MDQ0316156.1 YegS/Rv2252/BmrU family lipid kinase [Amorphus orientalis]
MEPEPTIRDEAGSDPALRRRPPLATQRILILANPTAGAYRRVVLDAVSRRLSAAGHKVTVELTRKAGDIRETCAGLADTVDTVVIAGGDGSVNEGLAGFQRVTTPPSLAVIPFGTANVLALELGLPRRPKALADMISNARTVPLHYGRANGHPFVLVVSAGYDAGVVHALPPALKRRFGKTAYALIAIRNLFGARTADITAEVDGETITCRLAAVTNVSRYGGPFVLCPEASATDPTLHFIALKRDDPMSIVKVGLALLSGRISRQDNFMMRPAREVRLSAASPVPCQVDGDRFATTPVTILPDLRPIPIIVA